MRRRVPYELEVRLNKALLMRRISVRDHARILTDYPYLSMLDWLRLWRATWGIRA